MVDTSAFVDALTLLGTATGVVTLCHYARLPTIVGFIVAGVVVGPSGLGLVSSRPSVGHLAEWLGVLLMFTIGLEFSFRKLKDLRYEFLRLGIPQVAGTVLVTALLSLVIFGSTPEQSLFYGFLVALSSTALVMKLLQDNREVESPPGKSSVGILLFQDVAVIPMMLAIPLLAFGAADFEGFTWTDALLRGLEITAILITIGLAAKFVLPFVLEKVVRTRSNELLFFFVVFLCLSIGGAFNYAGLSLTLGAFAAGVIISEGPYGRQVTSDLLPLRDNFFGLFFAAVGMLLDLSFIFEHLIQTLALGILLIVVKSGVILVASRIARLPLPVGLITGFGVCQIGEFSFILAGRGQDAGLLSDIGYQYFLSVSVMSMIATPFLFKLGPKLATKFRRSPWTQIAGTAAEAKVISSVDSTLASKTLDAQKLDQLGTTVMANHTIIIGFGIAGQNMAAAMRSLQIPTRVIEMNYEVVKRFKKEGVDIRFGDATRTEVLEDAGLELAQLVVITISASKVVPHVIANIRKHRPDLQIIVRIQYVREQLSLPDDPLLDVIIAEIETSIEVLARSLMVYCVPSHEIQDYMTQARAQLTNHVHRSRGGGALPRLTLPGWEAVSTIRAIRVAADDFAVGRALAELHLVRRSGAAVVTVYREGLGSKIPAGDFVLEVDDILHVVGSPDGQKAAIEVLKAG